VLDEGPSSSAEVNMMKMNPSICPDLILHCIDLL
jgi:hypothetical protein